MSFLEELKKRGLESHKFDKFRFKNAFAKISCKLEHPKVIQILGTNGKGSTGRFLANALLKKGYSVFHFTSPHIKSPAERFWNNAKILKEKELDNAVKIAQDLMDKKDFQSLSYFEFLTLLAMILAQNNDFLILEAGLGGEFDSTSSITPFLQIFTSISKDHQNILGKSIKKIATTKLKAIKATTIIAIQEKKEIYSLAKKIAKKKKQKIFFVENENLNLTDFSLKNEPLFFAQNRQTAFLALKKIGENPNPQDLLTKPIFGRFSKYKKNIFLDVGHNEGAAKEMTKFFQGKKVIIFFNSYKDKNYKKTLEALKPIAKSCVILPIKNKRIAKKSDISSSLKDLKIKEISFKELRFLKKETYLVFGSFLCVKTFLKEYGKLER